MRRCRSRWSFAPVFRMNLRSATGSPASTTDLVMRLRKPVRVRNTFALRHYRRLPPAPRCRTFNETAGASARDGVLRDDGAVRLPRLELFYLSAVPAAARAALDRLVQRLARG